MRHLAATQLVTIIGAHRGARALQCNDKDGSAAKQQTT
jgi:hypothetical protein